MPLAHYETTFEEVGLLADYDSTIAVIITHPWGVLGGNKHNPVVVAAARYFHAIQVTTVRFDFEGSQIGFGTLQVQQLDKMISAVLRHTSATQILLIGYSYGSLIAASIISRPEVIGMVAVAPPFGVAHWLFCFQSESLLRNGKERPDLPRLFVIGDADTFTDIATFQKNIDKRYAGAASVVMKGADHFFQRREKELMDIVGKWIVASFPHCQNDVKKFGGTVRR